MTDKVELRVYCQEDVDMTAQEFEVELDYEIVDISGVVSMDVDRLFESKPFEAIVTVEFDETVTTEEEIKFAVSSLSAVHNAK